MPRPCAIPWTDDEDRYLLSQVGDLTLRMIAEDLGRTYETVKTRWKYLRTRQELAAELGSLDAIALQDEIMERLKAEIIRGRMSLSQGREMLARLRRMLDQPGSSARVQRWPVQQWLEALA